MAMPAEIVAAAAAAFVGAMGTDAWSAVRTRCLEFFRRHVGAEEQTALTVRLDEFNRDLASVPEEDREGTVAVHARSVARDLRPITERSPEAAADLDRLVRELTAVTRAVQGSTVVNSGVRIEGNTVKRDLNFGGHTNTVGGWS